jgi:hypothetical protein
MILTSPSKDVDQAPPVTTTFDAPDDNHARLLRLSRRARSNRIDWDRVEQLYTFVRARAVDRLYEAEERHDPVAVRTECQHVHAVDAMFAQARRGHDLVAACAVTFFRARAMRDAHHPEFLGDWIGPSNRGTRSA